MLSGRGRTPTQLPGGFLIAANLTSDDNEYFLRDKGLNGLDSVAFHYSIYRSLTRFLGMDGNLNVAYDIDINFITAWNQMFVDNDFINQLTGKVDPRHMYGTSNFDVFRWHSLADGRERSVLATFIAGLVMPGIPLVGSLWIFTRILPDFLPSISMAKSRTSICMTPVLPIIFMGKRFNTLFMILATQLPIAVKL